MSGSAEYPPNPATVPIFATAAYLAGLVALWGFTSLILDRDVIDYPDAGLFLGPAMAVTGCAIVFIGSWRVRRSPTPILYGGLTALIAYALILAIGAIGYSMVRANLGVIPATVLHFALSPFMIGAAVLAGIVIAATALVTRPRPARD